MISQGNNGNGDSTPSDSGGLGDVVQPDYPLIGNTKSERLEAMAARWATEVKDEWIGPVLRRQAMIAMDPERSARDATRSARFLFDVATHPAAATEIAAIVNNTQINVYLPDNGREHG